METSLRCPLCSEWMKSDREPLLLNCGHSFCHDCIERFPVFNIYPVNGEDCSSETDSALTVTKPVSQKSFSAKLLQALGFPNTTTESTSNDRLKQQSQASQHSQSQHRPQSQLLIKHEESEDECAYIKCLVCSEQTVLEGHSVETLERNEMLALAADRFAAMQSVCGDCNEAESEIFCDECKIYLCETCNQRIHSGAITSRHSTRPIDQLGPKFSPTCPTFCSIHEKEEVVLFCAPCREMACVLCAYGDHKGHPVSLLSEAAVELCRKQEEYSGNLESEAELLLKTSETLRQELKRLEENSIAAKAFLASKVQSVLDTIQQFNQQMLERIDSEYHAKQKSLCTQMTDLHNYGRDMQLRSQLCTSIIQDYCHPANAVQLCVQQEPVINACLNNAPSKRQQRSSNIYVSLQDLSLQLADIAKSFETETFPRNALNKIQVKEKADKSAAHKPAKRSTATGNKRKIERQVSSDDDDGCDSTGTGILPTELLRVPSRVEIASSLKQSTTKQQTNVANVKQQPPIIKQQQPQEKRTQKPRRTIAAAKSTSAKTKSDQSLIVDLTTDDIKPLNTSSANTSVTSVTTAMESKENITRSQSSQQQQVNTSESVVKEEPSDVKKSVNDVVYNTGDEDGDLPSLNDIWQSSQQTSNGKVVVGRDGRFLDASFVPK